MAPPCVRGFSPGLTCASLQSGSLDVIDQHVWLMEEAWRAVALGKAVRARLSEMECSNVQAELEEKKAKNPRPWEQLPKTI